MSDSRDLHPSPGPLQNIPLRVRSSSTATVVSYTLRDPQALIPDLKVALPITFTPYAASAPCSARCVFCSENLRLTDAPRHASQMRPGRSYFEQLARVLRALDGLPMGLSLSGLEATDDPDWLVQLISTLKQHEDRAECRFGEKVLYSNGAGLADESTTERLLEALKDFGLDRIEWSRHSNDQDENDRIMRFRPGVAIAANGVFEQRLQSVNRVIPVTLVCLVQQGGIDRLDRAERYLVWAEALGVTKVVFREFASPGTGYRNNATLRTLIDRRVSCSKLIDEIIAGLGTGSDDFAPIERTEGYYFSNTVWSWRGRIRVIFESSDYGRMQTQHDSGVIFKLVFHPNGHLSADWDPNTHVLLQT